MTNNTIVLKESDSGGNKRKRPQKENEGKASQKKTLLSYFHSTKKEEPDNLNGTDVKPEISVGEGQTSRKESSENGEFHANMEIVDDKTEPEKNSQEISQSAFELKSPINGPENLNETAIKSETLSESQTSASTSAVKTSETEEPQDSIKSIDEMIETEKTDQESVQMSTTSAINGESHTPASTSPQEKVSENEEPQDIVKSEDDKEQEETNQECLQMDAAAINGPENLNEIEAKPGTSHEGQASASTSGEKPSEDGSNQDNVEDVAEMKEPEETSQESSQKASKPKSAYVDWRSTCYSVTCLAKKARKEGLFTDVQFVMGEGDKRREFRAHKTMLACASSVFEEMFFGPLPDERSIIETDDDPDAFEMLLDYIYGTSCFISSYNSLTCVCKYSAIGNKYLIPIIQDSVKIAISIMTINESDFWDAFQISNFNSLWPLFRNKFESYIEENANVLVPSEKFVNVSESIVNSVLQMKKVNIEEYPLLLGVTKWVYHNKDQVTPKLLMEYYKHIRFSTIERDDFIQFVDSYPEALDAKTYLRILHHMHSPSQYNLPEWCTTRSTSRVEEYEDSKHRFGCSCYRCYDSD